MLGTILKGKNYQINVARNGIEALDMVERARPDLILLDVMMPEMDGFETYRRLKNSPDTRDIPIVFLYLGGIRKVVSCSTWSRRAMVKVVL